jgi:hypothetical protein
MQMLEKDLEILKVKYFEKYGTVLDGKGMC